MGLSRAVIGILPQQNHLHIIIVGVLQRVENIFLGRINRPLGVFFLQIFPQKPVVFTFQIGLQNIVPAVAEKDHGNPSRNRKFGISIAQILAEVKQDSFFSVTGMEFFA